MASITWGQEIADVYDAVYAATFEPSVIDPIVGVLASLAGDGPVLEFAAGTGRVALALSARGIPVQGIELSPHMAARLRAKPGADAVPVTVGDMTTTRVPGEFTLVYLVANTIMKRHDPRRSDRGVRERRGALASWRALRGVGDRARAALRPARRARPDPAVRSRPCRDRDLR
jgi:hypothetical protein